MKEDSVKAGLNFSIQKTKIMASGLITSWQIDGDTMEYYSAVRRNEVHATTWMSLDNMLSEKSQSQKSTIL